MSNADLLALHQLIKEATKNHPMNVQQLAILIGVSVQDIMLAIGSVTFRNVVPNYSHKST